MIVLQLSYDSLMTCQEIEQKMDELARKYHDTHDPEIPEEIYELARRLKEMEH
jgi:NAD-dependent DNA ligase